MAIPKNAYLRQPYEASRPALGVDSVDEVATEDGSKLLTIPNEVRLWARWLLIPIDNEDGDFGKLHEIFSGGYRSLRDRRSSAVHQRWWDRVWGEYVAPLEVNDPFHIRTRKRYVPHICARQRVDH